MPHLLIDTTIDPSRIQTLATATGCTVELAPGPNDVQRELPEELLRDVRGILCTFLPTNHAAMTSLEWVQLCSAGYSQIENLDLQQRGITVCNATGVNDVPIAEWSVMMMVALARDLPQMFRNQQQGVWDRDARFQQEIRGRTLGIWGYGGIGRETARLADAMGLRVHVLTRDGKIKRRANYRVEGTGDDAGAIPQRVFAAADAEAFCQSLDYLLLAMPHTPENEGLIDGRIFQALPNHAFLINPARGKLVDEAALLAALDSGQIAGAALDTHFHYPMPADHPLWHMPNVMMTPHISGSSKSPHFADRLWALFTENVQRWQADQPLCNTLW